MTSKRKKLAFAILLVVTISASLFVSLSRNQITYFYTVDEVLEKPQNFDKKKIRVMGFVEVGSVEWNPQDTRLSFSITENNQKKLPVSFVGIKPDLFREGQGAVVEGKMKGNTFEATTLLVKHSEEYKVADHDKKKQDYLKSLNQE